MFPHSLLISALLVPPPAATPAKQQALESLIAAEYAFADMADRVNTRDAFLANLHEKSVMFNPGPVNGRSIYEKREPNATKLNWYPAFAEVSRACDLGWTTGPWEYRKAKDTAPVAYGWFISLWQREGKGPWKVMLDCGIDHPAPKEKHKGLTRVDATNLQVPEAPPAFTAVQLPPLDENFGPQVKKLGLLAAYQAILLPDSHLYRGGHFPAANPQAVKDLLTVGMKEPANCAHAWKHLGRFQARSGDLACTYGLHTRTVPGQEPAESTYIRIWKKLSTNKMDWKLIVEVENELGKEK